MARLMRVSTLARYAAQRDAPKTMRSSDARSAAYGIRWHENLVAAQRRSVVWFAWAMIIAVALLGAAFTLIGL